MGTSVTDLNQVQSGLALINGERERFLTACGITQDVSTMDTLLQRLTSSVVKSLDHLIS